MVLNVHRNHKAYYGRGEEKVTTTTTTTATTTTATATTTTKQFYNRQHYFEQLSNRITHFKTDEKHCYEMSVLALQLNQREENIVTI